MLAAMRVLLIAPLLLAGCLDSEVGYYDFESVIPLVATCAAGVDAACSAVWIDAVQDQPLDDLRIGTGDTETQAQFFRPDDSVFVTSITHQGDLAYSGETITENATVEGVDLGSDFSALLETNSVACEFDLRVTTAFAFREGEFEEADGNLSVEVTETQLSDNRCSIVSCLVEYSFILSHTAGGNPGLWAPRE